MANETKEEVNYDDLPALDPDSIPNDLPAEDNFFLQEDAPAANPTEGAGFFDKVRILTDKEREQRRRALQLRNSESPTARDPHRDLANLPLPEIGRENIYANSDAFKKVLLKFKDLGEEGLTDGEKKQIKAAAQAIPTIGEFVQRRTQLGEVAKEWDAEREKAQASAAGQTLNTAAKYTKFALQAGGKAVEEFHRQVMDKGFFFSVQASESGENAIRTAIDMMNYIKLTAPVKTEAIPQAPKDEAFTIYAEALRESQGTGPNLVAGAIHFAPYAIPFVGQGLFVTDIANDPTIVWQMAKQVPKAWITLYKAASGDEEALKTMRTHPFETSFAAVMPFLIGLGVYRGAARIKAGINYAKFQRALQKELANVRKVDPIAADAVQDATNKIILNFEPKEPQVEIPATPDLTMQRIKEAPTGDLMTELLELQKYSKTPFTASEIANMTRGEVEFLISGGRTGTSQSTNAQMGSYVESLRDIINQRRKGEAVPELKTEEFLGGAAESGLAGQFYLEQSRAGLELLNERYRRGESGLPYSLPISKTPALPAPDKVYGEGFTMTEPPPPTRRTLPSKPAGGKTTVQPPTKKPLPKKEPVEPTIPLEEPRKAPAAEIPKEPITQVELDAARKSVTDIQEDIASRQAWIDEIVAEMEKTGSKSKDAQEFIRNLNKQIAQRQQQLTVAEATLKDYEARPIKEPPPEPPEEPPEPVVPKRPTGPPTPEPSESAKFPGYREVIENEVLPAGVDVKMDTETGRNYVNIASLEKIRKETEPPPASEASADDLTVKGAVKEEPAAGTETAGLDEFETKLKDASEKGETDIVADVSQIAMGATEPMESPDIVKPTLKSNVIKFAERGMISIKKLVPDPARFQPRGTPYSVETYNRLNEQWNGGKFDDIVIWRDPKTGTDHPLTHSRYKFLIDKEGRGEIATGENVPYRRFEGTEAEAIEYAMTSNWQGSGQTLKDNVKMYRDLRLKGRSKEEILTKTSIPPELANQFEYWSYLNPKGEWMEFLSQEAAGVEGLAEVKKFARWVGELRKKYPDKLTDAHEQQLFNFYKKDVRDLGMIRDDFFPMIEKQLDDMMYDKSKALVLHRGEVKTGARARSDTQRAMAQIDEANEMLKKVVSAQEISYWQNKKAEAMKAVKDMLENQQSMFGAGLLPFGNYINAMKRVREGIKGARELTQDIIRVAMIPPDLRAGVADAKIAMQKHHADANEGAFAHLVLSSKFIEAVKYPERMMLIRDMLQIERPDLYLQYIEQDLKQRIPDAATRDKLLQQYKERLNYLDRKNLTPDEAKILDELGKEQDLIETFKLDNELVDMRNQPPGVRYVMQWWQNPETGKAFNFDYGRFTRSLPQAKPKEFDTYMQGEIEGGMNMALDGRRRPNLGHVIGMDFEAAMKAYSGRELSKSLAQIETGLPPGPDGRVLKMFEPWSDIRESAHADQYVAFDHPFLRKPITIKDQRGRPMVIHEKVGVYKELWPWVEGYFNDPKWSKLDGLLKAATAMKLAGVFHASQVSLTDLFMGRNPVGDILKARDLKKHPDEIVRNLARYGLKLEGWEELGLHPMDILNVRSNKGYMQPLKVALWPVRQVQKFTFETVVNNLKLGLAYDTFQNLALEYGRQGLPMEKAYRDAVKLTDRLFSHEDIRYAMLEADKFMMRYYYSTTARKNLTRLFLSPQWQKQHIDAFYEGTKAVIGKGGPDKRLYQRYMGAIAAGFGSAMIYNYFMTKHMDGEGKMLWENEELDPNKNWFYVRAPWNNPDGTRAWIHPFKTFYEVPEMISGVINGDIHKKIWNKMHPFIKEFAEAFQTEDPQTGLPDERTTYERVTDFVYDAYSPISFNDLLNYSKLHKQPVGVVVAMAGWPVSKGYPGGIYGKQIDEFKLSERKDRIEILADVDQAIVNGLNGTDGELMRAIIMMAEQLGMKDSAIRDRIMKFKDPLTLRWNKLGALDQIMFYNALNDEQKEEFMKQIGMQQENKEE